MSGNNSRYSPENREHLNNGYNGGETLKETFPPEKVVEVGENLPSWGGSLVHAGEAVYYIATGKNDEAIKHLVQAGVGVLIPSSGNTFVDYTTGQVVSLGVDQSFEQMQQDNTQQDTDKPAWYETVKDAIQKAIQRGEYNPKNYQTEQSPRYDSDLQQQYEQELKDAGVYDADGYIVNVVELGNIGRKYDQKQAERNEHKQSENDGNKLKMDTPNLDNPSKDNQKSDDDNKSEWEQFWDNPLQYGIDLAKDAWNKLWGKDKDDNQIAKDNNGTDPQSQDGKDTPADTPKEQPQNENTPEQNPAQPNGKDGESPDGQGAGGSMGGGGSEDGQGGDEHGGGENGGAENGGGENGSGSGTGSNPGAGSAGGFGGGLGGGGSLGDFQPNKAYADPLLIDLNTHGRIGIKVVSYHDENGGKWLDINGDGIANNVSWIAPNSDTGALFYDENNNNKMDGFQELFTDGKLMNNGEISKNGFDYAKNFDTDGNLILDENDEKFSQIKVLTIDEDGNEIVQSLTEASVKSLNLNYDEFGLDRQHNYPHVNDENLVLQEGTYVRADGRMGQLSDVNFTYDTINTKYVDAIELTTAEANMANLQGFGFLRDLNQAATQSEDLNKKLTEYSQLESKEEQLDYLDNLIKSWAETSPYYTHEKANIQEKEFYRDDNFYNTATQKGLSVDYIIASQMREMKNDLQDLDSKLNPEQVELFNQDSTQDKLHILQQFYGISNNAVYLEKPADLGNVIDNIEKDYANLKEDAYQHLLFQTRLKPYLQEISVNENNEFDFSGVEDKFAQVYQENPEKALLDLGEFLQYSNIGELDTNLTKQFAKYYVQMGENAEELIDKEVAKQIIFPDEKDIFADEETDNEINTDEIDILSNKISIDNFAAAKDSVEENPQDFNDELAYLEYMPDWRYEEQDEKEPDDDWLF